ncbi:mechanosensitive ion channel family protein [Hymenobacter rubripertinctus]|uniref:Mechanosensitive ion channel family protein n=1 Tax=Hymenobacter rubripertinctus TaxID=2029981 RepID=A0A418R200_9BACT|nr:mechanosensitive ion channel family protein [Hymenobacter rubripertinctus]RIY11398.1 mechanosensitive ion channel family protein [Hymenobacter rubripertinctus]
MDFSIAWQKLNGMGRSFMAVLPNLLIGLVVLVVFIFIARGIRSLVLRVAQNRHQSQSLTLLLSRLAYVFVLIFGILVMFTIMIPSFTPTSLLSALGVGGVAIGFAFKDIFQNFLAGVLLLLTEPFRINDQIKYKDFEGTVENIQTRATTIKTYDGRRVVIPNAELFINAVTVNTAYDQRRLQYDIGIGYGDDIAAARKLIIEAMQEAPNVLNDPVPEALIVDLAGSSVNIRARWWIKPPRRADFMDSQNEVLELIKNKLTAAGIDLPFPTQQILWHDQTEETDGNRQTQREGWPAGKGEVPRSRAQVRAEAEEQRQQLASNKPEPRQLTKSTEKLQPEPRQPQADSVS